MLMRLAHLWNSHRVLPMLALALAAAGCTFTPLASAPSMTDAAPAVRVLIPTPTTANTITAPTSPLSPEQAHLLAGLSSQGPAPALTNEIWLNSPPLNLAELHGKVVMVEFWTYGCINCRNVIPALQQWHTEYADEGLVIISIHTPEFAYEKDLDNVQAAMVELGVTWPVAIDNEWITWRAYANHYWPALYLIDKRGEIRLLKIGEGQYTYTESVIQALLAEPG